MNKKGFTLPEMLITVSILGFIILIVAPNITGLLKKIDDEKYQRFLSDVFLATEAYIQANIEEYASISVENEKVYIYFENLINAHYLKSDVYDPKNKKRVDEENFTVEVYLNDNDEYSYKLYEKHFVPGPTLVAAQAGETHKGIVYLDPTDLTKVCTEEDADANVNEFGTPTEIKTGCMKWYIFDDTGDNYTMILDHNTIARIKWNNEAIIVAYENSNLKPEVDNLVTTSGWKVTPRLITVEEVNTITGKTGFDSTNENSWYYFDTLTQTKAIFSDSVRSSYDWLYNNTYKCKTNNFGCTIEDNNSYMDYDKDGADSLDGYWTSTPIDPIGGWGFIWYVSPNGATGYYGGQPDYGILGIRPVIEVSKSLFD